MLSRVSLACIPLVKFTEVPVNPKEYGSAPKTHERNFRTPCTMGDHQSALKQHLKCDLKHGRITRSSRHGLVKNGSDRPIRCGTRALLLLSYYDCTFPKHPSFEALLIQPLNDRFTAGERADLVFTGPPTMCRSTAMSVAWAR